MKIINKVIDKALSIDFFKMVFLVSSFLYCIPFTNFLFTKIFKIFIIWGIFIFVYNYFYNKKYTLKRIDYLLFVFLFIALISVFLNYNMHFMENLVTILYLFIQTILMLSYVKYFKFNDRLRHIKFVSYIIVILTFVSAVLSIFIFLLNFKYTYNDALFGVYEGRLWGFYGNPNSLGHFSLMSIWLSIIIIIINKYSGQRNNVFLYINIIIEFICLVLSNSRSTILGSLFSFLFFTVFMFALNFKRDKTDVLHAFKKNSLSILTKVCLMYLIVFVSFIITKNTMSFSLQVINNLKIKFYDVEGNTLSTDNSIASYDQKNRNGIVDRDYKNSDISNGRFELWSAGLKVFINHPFGVGQKNINFYANEHMSNATKIETPRLSENMHNIFLQVLVAHGIFAFIIFVIYILKFIIKYLKLLLTFTYATNHNILIYKLIVVNLSIIIALVVINLFDSNLLYFCSVFFTFVFWNTISTINSLSDYIDTENKKVLFLINDLGGGGAEKVLIDLTNNLNFNKYDIYVKTIYNDGIYINQLNTKVDYSYIIKKPNIWKKRIVYRLVKYLPNKFLHDLFISEKYDIEIAFLESLPTKIIAGSTYNSYKIAWVHVDIFTLKESKSLYISKKELIKVYRLFDRIVCVSDSVKDRFIKETNLYQETITIYNPIDKESIINKSKLKCDIQKKDNKFIIVSIGRLTAQKGYLLLCEVINKISKQYDDIELWILGEGEDKNKLQKYINDNHLDNYIKLLGFHNNPYNYLKQADLFISSSYAEGFSLVLAEAMVLGIPILSTRTSGPDNLLDNGKYGDLVDCSFDGIYYGLLRLINDHSRLKDLRNKSLERSKIFGLKDAVNEVENLISYKDVINKESKLFCTVFTPTYNRAYTLERLYNSLKKQTDKDFEWVVVDDGSVDETEKLFKKWKKESNGFNITYIKQENGGKQKAINTGLDYASGKMFFIVDSDDYLTSNAIELLKKYEISISNFDDFAGVSGLKGYDVNKVVGDYNNNEICDCTNLEREENRLNGDKAECYYTDLLRRNKFPIVNNERFITENIVWNKIAFNNYKIRWFNSIIYICNYLEDGYTNQGNILFTKNPIGYLLYIRDEAKYYPLDLKRNLGNYYRYYNIMKNKEDKKLISEDLIISKFTLNLSIFLGRLIDKIKRR